VIDRFAQPLRCLLQAVSLTLTGLGVHPRRQFVLCQRLYESWFRLWNVPTRHWRVLPDVLLIGVTKGGTSSLSNYLSLHPDFHPPIYKEPHYFDLHANKDAGWYRAHFPLRVRKWLSVGLQGRPFLTGDFTPSYYILPHGPRTSRALLGDIKIIISLRNPIDRAYSHYRDSRRIGYEVLEHFEDALKAEGVRLRGEVERMEREPNYCSEPLLSFGYRTRGIYIDFIKRWREYYPDPSILVLNFDEWSRSPQRVFARICEFLGLGSFELPEYPAINVGGPAEEAMSSKVRESLAVFYKPHNEALYAYLGTDFGWH
jgi:hypothetical protein